MTENKQTKPDQSTDALERTLCRKCKGAGVIFTTDVCGTQAICCDQCSAGNRMWSRLLELLADVDVPSPVLARPESIDSIARDQLPRRHPWLTSGLSGFKNGR
jgi:hypothetical protein